MSILMIPLLALLALVAALASTSEQGALDMLQRQEAVASGGSLRIYANAVARFAKANPGFSGTATANALDLPTWFSPQLGTSNVVAAGSAYVFVVPSNGVPDLYRMFPEDEVGLPLLFGVARSGYLSSPSAGAAALPLPAGIPEGAIVYVL
ncbi:type IV pilus biogenesis protein PilM [Achromobacter xylosoxidans]|uniref:type IV pilus biogenesis protein PilM n=1 Tax=Alcaligenes xylosoxydans xylosoxydans TaxID=85698 RepID=UPI000479B6A3|nr:type IV pilus biogenesis protein PilM [Achromobacter xylosoxidans]